MINHLEIIIDLPIGFPINNIISPSGGRFVNNGVCVTRQGSLPTNGDWKDIICNQPISGRYLYFTLPVVIILTLCEVEVRSSACALCPAHSNSPMGSVAVGACTCDPGYSGPDGGACVECTAGSFKAGPGAGSCVACPANSIPMVGSNSSTGCLCGEPLHGRRRGVCVMPDRLREQGSRDLVHGVPGRRVLFSRPHAHTLDGLAEGGI